MAIEVEGPDDTIIEFPDDTPHDTIKSVMRRRYGAPASAQPPVPAPGPAPQVATGPAALGTGAGILPLIQWFAGLEPKDKQVAYDMIGQTIGTTAGVVAGTPAGPPGQIVGGAAGSVGGKQLARTVGPYIGGEGERPDLASVETAIDAGAGAFGPAVGSLARGGARLLSGLSRKGVTAAEEAGAAKMTDVSAHQANTAKMTRLSDEAVRDLERQGIMPSDVAKRFLAEGAEKQVGIDSTLRAISGQVKAATDAEVQQAVKVALDKAANRSTAASTLPGAVAGLATSFEPITGILLGAGIQHTVVQKVLPAILQSEKWGPRFASWALNVEKGAVKKGEIAASFTALATEAGLIETEPERETSKPKPLGRRSEGPKPPRDAAGRFAGWDHSALEEMFDGGLA